MKQTFIVFNEQEKAFGVVTSNDPKRRLRELQESTTSPLTMYKTVSIDRKEILDDLQHYIIRGFWVSAEPVVKNYFDGMK